MMFGSVDCAAVRRTNHHWPRETAASPMAHARHVIDDLVESRIEKAHELDLGHRFQAVRRHADGHARDHGLGERRVLDAVRAEPGLQARGRAEHAAIGADILADHDDGVVMLHLPAMRHRDGLDHGYLRQFNDRWISRRRVSMNQASKKTDQASKKTNNSVRSRAAPAGARAALQTGGRTWHRWLVLRSAGTPPRRRRP